MAKGGGTMEIIMLVVLLAGAWLLWPHISGMLSGGEEAIIGATQTDTSGGGEAKATDKGGNVSVSGDGRSDRRSRIRNRRRHLGGVGDGMVSVDGGIARAGRGGTTATAGGGQATACAGGRCVTAYGEMQMDFSNVI